MRLTVEHAGERSALPGGQRGQAARRRSSCSWTSNTATGSAKTTGVATRSYRSPVTGSPRSGADVGRDDRSSDTARLSSWCLRAPARSSALITWPRAQRAANAPNGPRSGCQARIAPSSPSLASWASSSRSQPYGGRTRADDRADQRLVAAQQLLHGAPVAALRGLQQRPQVKRSTAPWGMRGGHARAR